MNFGDCMSKLLLKITLFCFLLIGCTGDKYCLRPEIVTNKINIKKELLTNIEKSEINENVLYMHLDLPFQAKGFLIKSKRSVSIKDESTPPVKKISCYDESNNLLWVYPSGDRPYKMTQSISIYEDINESFIILMEWTYLRNVYDIVQSVVILNEDGKPLRKLDLPGYGDIYKHRLGETKARKIFGSDYLLSRGGDGIAIFDFNSGQMMTFLYSSKVAPKNPGVIERVTDGGKYIVFLVDLRSYAKSSILFILSDKWELLYEEVIPSCFLFSKLSGTNDSFIIKTFEIKDCNETGNDIIWKYTISRGP